MVIRYLLTIMFCFFVSLTFCQPNKRAYTVVKTTELPKIDGRPFEKVWDLAESGTDFIMLQPTNGAAESSLQKTAIKVLYDDKAIYVAAYLYDSEPGKIDAQFSQRDQVNVQADLFTFWINTYNNQIDQTRFYITAAGAIADSKATNGSEDFSYNVLFNARMSKDEKGWYAEFEIPYQALRFARAEIQNWSFNALRRINRLNQSFTFNFVDILQGNEAQYDAMLLGIEKINPPLRLSLFPYASIQNTQFENQSENKYNAGLDVKIGLSDAFTLDATLIPDFGQVGFDEVELNLGPFEQTFQERRPFFTEGTELFTRGNLFFSRRIGQTPSGFNDVKTRLLDNEKVLFNPEQSPLLNAVKITGRSKSKLGIGFLNAITKETAATVRDTVINSERKLVTEPLTNYTILVIDKQYGANSSIFFSTANTLRSGSFADASVSALGFEHYDKKNIYKYEGDLKVSSRFQNSNIDIGYSFSTRWQRVEGQWRYGISYNYTGKSYNPNDLGLQYRSNINSTYIYGSYNQFTPKGKFNNYSVSYGVFHERVNSPSLHSSTSININPNFQTKKLWEGGAFFTLYTRELDFFESRIPLTPVLYRPRIIYGSYLTTDTRKRVVVTANVNAENRFNDLENRFDFSLQPSFRITEKLFIRYTWFWQQRTNRLSFVSLNQGKSVLSLRNTKIIENSLESVYNFDTNKSVNLKLRSFWTSASFSEDLKLLLPNGKTEPFTSTNNFKPNADFNVWNFDCSFKWQFASASDLTLLYRNNLSNFQMNNTPGYFKSMNQLFQQSFAHLISLRVSYFLDSNKL